MLVFVDFEASSLSRQSYPIEVGWVFEDGRQEAHLIRPAVDWDDWDTRAQAIHGIERAALERDGEAHAGVAQRMIEALDGHDLLASAPSWDGKWLSRLLRAADLPRHALRLRSSEEAMVDAALSRLANAFPADEAESRARLLVAAMKADSRAAPAHRALADAAAERALWQHIADAAAALAERSADATRSNRF